MALWQPSPQYFRHRLPPQRAFHHDMNMWNPQDFGPAMAALIDIQHRSPLGPGRPREESRAKLAKLTVEIAFAHTQIADDSMANCCLSGLWLHHDFLDESHDFSQEIHNASGSYWHGIMHRREQDYSNAKYWFRKVGDHPVFELLPDQFASAGLSEPANASIAMEIGLDSGSWDSYAFVDACQQVAGSGSESESFCRELAWLEWQTLFQFCYDRAVA